MLAGGMMQSRTALVSCQVCGQDQTLVEEAEHLSTSSSAMYIMECCFSIVCRECNGVTSTPTASSSDVVAENEQAKSRICFACLESNTKPQEGR